MRLQGKVAVVTGSGAGIGRAIAIRLAREGADVVVNDVNATSAAETRAEVESAGRRGLAVVANVGTVAGTRQLIEEAARHFGKLDVLVNNAGVCPEAPFEDVTEADYDRVLNINLKGSFFASQAFARHLLDARRPGKIVIISSCHEDLPLPGSAAYCASKGGLRMLTRNLAVELGRHGITVNAIAPGAIATPGNDALLADKPRLEALLKQIPLGRLGTPEEVAGLAAFLASADADYVTGSTYYIDGGLTWHYEE
jgi:glucose 1-dehydrogenase